MPMEGKTRPILGRFVVFEGLDGAGTTTQLGMLDSALAKAGVPHWITFEPSTHPAGRLVRQVLRGEVAACPETLARLFSADRHEHIRGVGGIIEHLRQGELVICDRYVLSSLAYQGVACGPELPRLLNADFPLPELLVYFDLPSAVAMKRVESREEREIFETLSMQEKVRAAYEASLLEFADSGMRILRVDATRGVAEVGAAILETVLGLASRPDTH